MPWWGWLVLGIGLLGVEMFVVDAQFYLVFIGVAAALVGLLGLAGIDLPQWAQWLAFAALAIVTMLAFRKRRVRSGARPGRAGGERLHDRAIVSACPCVSSPASPAASTIEARPGRRATSMTARSRRAPRRVISHVDGLTLHLKSANA